MSVRDKDEFLTSTTSFNVGNVGVGVTTDEWFLIITASF
jgi:hypothetical protein